MSGETIGSAKIIPFVPRKSIHDASVVPEVDGKQPLPRDRLTQALALLQASLEAQSHAVRAWRNAHAALKKDVSRLENNLSVFQRNMTELQAGLAHLGRSAEWLHRHRGGYGQ